MHGSCKPLITGKKEVKRLALQILSITLARSQHMKNHTVQLIAGMLTGLALPPLALWLIFTFRSELLALQSFDDEVIKVINVQLITLGILLNAGAFFLFLRLNKEAMGRGVLIVTVLYLLAIFIYRFLL